MKVLIGCPVYRRAWILGKWFDAIQKQTMPLKDIGFVFLLSPDDLETYDLLWEWKIKHPEVATFSILIKEDIEHYTHPDGQRTWTDVAYHKMVDLRNTLLDFVREVKPDKYFSLDSDLILEDKFSLEKLYHNLERDGIDAISPLSYMYPEGTDFPSVMSWINEAGGLASRQHEKYLLGKVFKVDIIMAAVMMNPSVYLNARYQWHPQGEDLGWSTQCSNFGFNLYCASDIYVTHVMHKWMLESHLDGKDSRKHQTYTLI